ADGVNVGFDTYRIRTEITENGAKVDAGLFVDRRDRQTRAVRWEQLDEDLAYTPGQLDRDVVAEDQIRTVVQAFRDRLFTELFRGRTEVPKTIIFAKDDSHADDIVRTVRDEFGKGNDFCQKITYRTTGAKPEDLLTAFRNSYNPRIVVTVDMIATGTDIKPVEVVFFMRNVRSRNFFEQMKGRGVRTISSTEFNQVTPDASVKDRFVIVDAVGVTDPGSGLSESYTLNQRPFVPMDKLLDQVAWGDRNPDVLITLASRLARLDRRLTSEDRASVEAAADGQTLQSLIGTLVDSDNPDKALEAARLASGLDDPPKSVVDEALRKRLDDAARPIAANPALRQHLSELHRRYEQTIDTVSADTLLGAGYSEEEARKTVKSFREYLEEHRDEITALQVLYARPYTGRLRHEDVRALADALKAPPRSWTPETLWAAYARLDASKVRGSSQRMMTDIVALVRYAIGDADELAPFADGVHERFRGWMAVQEAAGRSFTQEQVRWLEDIRNHIAGSVGMEMRHFELPPFKGNGGLGQAYTLFGKELQALLEELNLELVG
ncbi:MAG: helicase-related protein, partial [Chloroflexota bacterium]|nr:helicase-related protein [Chloroflexota bacterium]